MNSLLLWDATLEQREYSRCHSTAGAKGESVEFLTQEVNAVMVDLMCGKESVVGYG